MNKKFLNLVLISCLAFSSITLLAQNSYSKGDHDHEESGHHEEKGKRKRVKWRKNVP